MERPGKDDMAKQNLSLMISEEGRGTEYPEMEGIWEQIYLETGV